MVSRLILAFSLAVQLYSCQSSIEENSQSLQKGPCWMCNVTHCQQCVASQWTPWNQCSAPCGKNGYQSRTRLVSRPPSCGVASSCRDLTKKEWRPCNRFCFNGGTLDRWACRCPLNYTGDCCETAFLGWSMRGDWGQCSKSCSSGMQERMRVCIASSPFIACDNVCNGTSIETRECNTHECPVKYDSLGCFNDGNPRALPELLENFRGKKIDWTNMPKIVQACAEVAHERGLQTFGLQFYGECWSGVNGSSTYDMYGPSTKCWSGVGKEGSYYVYKLKV